MTEYHALDKVQAEEMAGRLADVLQESAKVIVGQGRMMEGLLLGMITGGHILLEGVPGLAKTLAVSTLARCVAADFRRIQFTPDLLPADITGTTIYNRETGEFTVKRGPVFSNIILADEINRAPAKVQSALLEAMQERQVTIGNESFKLGSPFLVMATQNPIEQEGTYPLPEAQLDRFMLKVLVGYLSKDDEVKVIDRMAGSSAEPVVSQIMEVEEIHKARELVRQVFVDDKVKRYVVELVHATRNPGAAGMPQLKNFIENGASTRASINLIKAGKAHALLSGRSYLSPHDIKTIATDVLRHRVLLTYEAEAEGRTPDSIIATILENIEVP